MPDPDQTIHVVRHRYDIGNNDAFVSIPEGVNGPELAAYMQFMAERWFGEDVGVENDGIADALIAFYGCATAVRPTHRVPDDRVIDMYWVREQRCGPECARLMADPKLAREGMLEFLSTRYWQ